MKGSQKEKFPINAVGLGPGFRSAWAPGLNLRFWIGETAGKKHNPPGRSLSKRTPSSSREGLAGEEELRPILPSGPDPRGSPADHPPLPSFATDHSRKAMIRNGTTA